MTSPPLSPSQARAVGSAFADALVTAGAGSGKTRVLSERFVHLVRAGHVALRRLAALTFTEKAAAQMRDRIAGLFRERQLALGATDGEEHARLAALRADVEFAPISTIHAFCALLLRQHAVEAGVDPSFQVLDGVESDLLLDDAASLAENLIAEQSPELIAVLHALPGQPRAKLVALIQTLRGAGCDPGELQWRDGGLDLQATVVAVEDALRDFALVGDQLEDARQPLHGDAVALVGAALQQVGADDEAAAFLCAQAATQVKHLAGPRKRLYTAPRVALERGLLALTAGLLDAWGARRFLPALRRVLSIYAQAYEALKDERGALDFTDLELRARDVLRRAHDAGRPLDLAPQALLVDEFQDTNPLQAEILALLRAADVPQFSVGDPKQGIYRFRRADVHVMLREQERVGAAARFPMNTSYRACAPLVLGINAMNAALFADGRAGVDYEPLAAAAPFLPPDGPAIEFAVIDGSGAGNLEAARAIEAAWIAERIARLVEDATPRLKPQRDAQGRPTGASVGPLRYGDVAVLFRATSSLPIYERALEARGVPYLTQTSRGFFRAEEISDLLHVLRVIHNPADRFALAAFATGPAVAATDLELLRWFGKGDDLTPWQRMRSEAAAGGPHRHVLETLEALRIEAGDGSLATAVERALTELGLYETALLRPGGDRAAANLRKAVEFARRLDRGGRRGLADLLRHLATLRDRQATEAEAPIGGEIDDVVRLTTVHGAKGLEYPIVFVADIGRKEPGRRPELLFDGARDIAVKLQDPLEGTSCEPGGWTQIAEREKEEEAQEALRVLYVAMTRAEERLVLTGSCTGPTKKGEPAYFAGWGRALWDVLDLPFEHGQRDVVLPAGGGAEATVRVYVVDGAGVPRPAPVEVRADVPVATEAALVEARARLAAAAADVAPLGHTRYVVSVSELLAFAESPQRYYLERVVLAGGRVRGAAAWDAPAHDVEPAGEDAHAARRAARAALWDEPPEPEATLDRAAVGRAVHAVLEHVRAGDVTVPATVLERAVGAEGGDETFAAAVGAMAQRFLDAPLGAALRAALREGLDVRGEVALHARIRFPGGEPVGGFDSLLVKGSIDLWLPTAEGVLVVDHKTNRKGGAFRSAEALAAHYAWQLRLYALATERALGADVAGARLALLDPGWGAGALEVEVDVSGPQLEEARRLCRAFAVAELEGRYPEDWQTLLA